MNQKVAKKMWYLVYENAKVKVVLRWQRRMSELTKLTVSPWFCISASSCDQHDLSKLALYSVTFSKVHAGLLPCNVAAAQFADRLLSYTNTVKIELFFRGQHTDNKLALLFAKYGSAESLRLFYYYSFLTCLYINAYASHQYLRQQAVLYGICIYQGIASTDVSASEERQASWLKSKHLNL